MRFDNKDDDLQRKFEFMPACKQWRDQLLTHSEKLPIRYFPNSLFPKSRYFTPLCSKSDFPFFTRIHMQKWSTKVRYWFCIKMLNITISMKRKMKKKKLPLTVSEHQLLQQAALKNRLNSGSVTKGNNCNIEACPQATEPWRLICWGGWEKLLKIMWESAGHNTDLGKKLIRITPGAVRKGWVSLNGGYGRNGYME